MTNQVSAAPEGYSTITPYLIVDDASQAIDFYKQVLGAVEVMRLDNPDGKVGHAELKIGDSKIMLADECPEMEIHAPDNYGGSPVGIHVYVHNVDATLGEAIKAGATLCREAADQFYGDRSGAFKDPFGHTWYVATHVEDLSEDEVRRRAAELFGKQ
ncbi:VOC family protein [Legionella taurinensis]|uniref:Glyoxalase n=1 Tax=Legionella taurinensis TaxID=70611 RepID=A0A3A5L1Y4_9GAMM|nr:VOC family protein [Legionella taurinensis]MDX1836077.1 VOC family protein [Legionella taurinensis]PUT42147.1 glyoxalase [Legionella taurinensis]PUT44934.1 glyoxalase [Legionella taurinensis]PUT48256.1 glyoxalase [Legionella taurinensis]PUT49069.1 glyoxalase [Legionella taurinensis]